MASSQQVTGKIKGTRLTVVKFSHIDEGYRKVMLFRCDCGNYKKIRLHHVQRLEIKSCGCLQKEFKHTSEHMKKMRASPKRLPNLRKQKRTHSPANKGMIRIYQYPGSKTDKGKICYVSDADLNAIRLGVIPDPTQI